MEDIGTLVVILEASIVIVLVMRILVGGHHLEHVILDRLRSERAVPASDQASLDESTSRGEVVPALELVILEQLFELFGAVLRDVQNNRGVFTGHDRIIALGSPAS